MDILPEPNDAAPFLTQIPYLPQYSWEPCGAEDFLGIPRKHGFLDHAGKFKPQHDTYNMASMLQAWLFFELLAKGIGRGFKVQDFVRQNELGQDVITLAPLKKRKISRGQMAMKIKMEMELKIIDFRPSLFAHLPHVFEVWHSIMWLYEVLATRASMDASQMSTKGSAIGDFDIPPDPFQRRSLSQLDRTQWCPFNRRRLQSLQSCTLRYVTSIPRQSFPPFLTHRNCSENACTGNAIDVERFQTRHVDEDCSCSFIGVSPSIVASICRQGSFPLVEIRPTGSQSQTLTDQEEIYNSSHSIDISVRSWTPSSRFTAISHVWSHGLGNQQSNSLPICQLKKLALAVHRASHSRKGPQLIWMDILCIPVQSEYAAERRTSIDKMGIIYAAAETVLVLDYELLRIPIKNLDRLQVLAHLLTCSWMERAWTFNEGSLSRSCCLQFADEIFDTERIREINRGVAPTDFSKRLRYVVEIDLSKHCLWEFSRELYKNSASHMIPRRLSLPNNLRWDSASISGWNALRCRSTSQPEDLLVILANLRGISLSHLSRFRPEEKLAVLISFQRFIPFTLLTSPNQSKSSCLSEPNRWIPRTFDGSYISGDHLLQQRPLGDALELNHKHFRGPKRLSYLSLIMLPLSLDLSGDRDIQICANGSKINLRVKFLRESYPPLNHVSTMKFLVVEAEDEISIKPNLPLKGCCLQLSDSIDLSRNKLEQSGKLCASLKNFLSEHHKELRFTYDCPIRVESQEDLSLLSHPETSPVSTPCRPDEAHQVAGPWTIIIKCNLFRYREQAACRGNFSSWMHSTLYVPINILEFIKFLSDVLLIFDLGVESQLSTTKAQVLDFPRYQKCSYTAIAFTVGRYIWAELDLQKIPFDKKLHVLESILVAHALITDIFIFSFSFKLYKASRPSIARLTFVTFHTFINLFDLVYYTVLHQKFGLYILNVWLATFQDDWSWKTHNKRWWTLFKCFGGSTPDTAFEDQLVSRGRFWKWYNRLAKSFRLLKAGFGLFRRSR